MIVLLSFLLDGIISKQININFLMPLTTLMSLIIIYPYINKKKYFSLCFIVGLLYDIGYTNTLLFNAFIFLLLGYIISKINIYLKNNVINTILISLITIIIYRIVTYMILVFINYLDFNINTIFNSIISSLLLNIIYVILLYIIKNGIKK